MRSALESIETIASPNTNGIVAEGDAVTHMMQAVSENELEAKERKVWTLLLQRDIIPWGYCMPSDIFTNSDRHTDPLRCYEQHNRLSSRQRKPSPNLINM